MSGRELPEGVPRRQIVVLDVVREYLRERSDEEDMTISEFLKETAFPDDWKETLHEYEDHEMARLKLTPAADEMVDGMTGERLDKGEVIAFYVLLDALREGNRGTAEDLIEYVPEVLWDEMGGRP
jgi:hypothetical protein